MCIRDRSLTDSSYVVGHLLCCVRKAGGCTWRQVSTEGEHCWVVWMQIGQCSVDRPFGWPSKMIMASAVLSGAGRIGPWLRYICAGEERLPKTCIVVAFAGITLLLSLFLHVLSPFLLYCVMNDKVRSAVQRKWTAMDGIRKRKLHICRMPSDQPLKTLMLETVEGKRPPERCEWR